MKFYITLTLVLFIFISVNAQYNGNLFSISLNGNYTTSAKIYLNPNSPDIDLKNRSNPVSDIFSPSLDIRYALTEEIFLGISTEYLYKVSGQFLTVLGTRGTESISIDDGFRLIPFELFLHYLLPFSTENFKFLIGGGAAYYYGSHVRKFGNEDISNVKRDFAYGIQVTTTMDYLINSFIAVRAELKFRDPEFETTNRYDKNTVNYNGEIIRLNREQFDSKINIDGITFTCGVAFGF
jgi:outer membrane protein W